LTIRPNPARRSVKPANHVAGIPQVEKARDGFPYRSFTAPAGQHCRRALYLINIVYGAFAIGFVPATWFASDPATTAANIQAHELLYRSGLAAHVIVTVTVTWH
jgi:hypothetical protein